MLTVTWSAQCIFPKETYIFVREDKASMELEKNFKDYTELQLGIRVMAIEVIKENIIFILEFSILLRAY
jgi:hypothetical protein